jgi:hypothetical protein
MKDPLMRLVRCPQCRLRFETANAFAVCVGCGTAAVDENAVDEFDDAREEVPTQRQHVILPPKE